MTTSDLLYGKCHIIALLSLLIFFKSPGNIKLGGKLETSRTKQKLQFFKNLYNLITCFVSFKKRYLQIFRLPSLIFSMNQNCKTMNVLPQIEDKF